MVADEAVRNPVARVGSGGQRSSGIDVSIVIPVFNEAESVESLARELTAVMTATSYTWECLWVDDASTDATLARLAAFNAADSRHRYVALERNSAKAGALIAGFRESRGRIIATLDGDGQNDPADLPGMIAALDDPEVDCVQGYRARRADHAVRRLSSRVGNAARTAMTGWLVRDVGCATRVFRRECVDYLPRFRGVHRFFATVLAMEGFRVSEVAVHHRPRRAGRSKYGIHNRLWVGIIDLLGVSWLRARSVRYRVRKRSDPAPAQGHGNESGTR